MTKIYTLVVCFVLICAHSVKAQVVINELYGAGGNAGATYQNDFVELYNRADNAVIMTSWSLQYTSSAGNSWGSNKVTFSGTIPSKGYFLIKLAGGTTGTPLPSEDASGGINLSGTSGKIVLCNDAVNVSSVANPVDANIVDKLGFGAAATGFEGTGPSPAPSATTSVQRTSPGVDSDNNNSDFVAGAPTPTNASPGSDIIPPVYTILKPGNNSTDVFTGTTFSMVFSETVQKGAGNIVVKNASDNAVLQTIDVLSAGVTVSTSNVSFSLSGLAKNTAYYIEIDKGVFKDLSGNDFAGISGDVSWKFTTTAALYGYDFSSCTGTVLVEGFNSFSKVGAQVWGCTTFGLDANNLPSGSAPNGLQINGYDNALASNVPNEDWLISPAFDLSGTSFPLLSFWSRTRFNGLPLQLKISTDYTGTGDPANATWTDLNGRFPNQTSDVWTRSSNINLSAFKQAGVYIAFVYVSSDEEGARWTLDDVRIDNSTNPPASSVTLSATDIQFVYTAAGSTTDKNFSLTGNDITDVITLTASGGFQLSKDGTAFSSSISYTVAEANNTSVNVIARFAPSANDNNYTGTITINTAGASALIQLKGSSIDVEKTLEIVNWNIEWFGATGFGPTNEDQQEQNVRTILQSINADLYGLVEVVDTARLGRVVRQMPGYSYIVGNYGSYSNPYVTNPSPLGTLQKLAFVYKTAVISNIDTLSLLSRGVNTAADLTNPSYNSWASGRYPYMLSADVTLGGVTKNVKFILLHAKANTSPTITSYNRRKAGEIELIVA